MNTKILAWSASIIFYAALLSVNLLALPLYLDEGIYIYWAYLSSLDPSYAYVSMQDGKTPLFMWLTAFLNQPFNNFLLTARLISVIASTITLICWLIIASKTFGQKILPALFILFLISPFNILFSRLAFADSLLTAFGSLSILTLFFIRNTSAKKRILSSLGLAVLTGVFLGLAFITKTTARIFFIAELLLFGFLIIEYIAHKQIRAALIITVSALVTAGVYFELVNFIRVGAYRFWGMISEKESDLVFTLPEIFNNIVSFNFFAYNKNLPNVFEYFGYYFASLSLFFFFGCIWIIKHKKHRWVLFLTFFLFAGIFLSAKLIASRYFVILVPEFLLISSIGFIWVWKQKSQVLKILSIALLVLPAIFTTLLLLDPFKAYYPQNDRAGFIDYNLNAYGLNESVALLLPEKTKAVIGVTGIWGVSEGAYLAFKEQGFETYRINNLVAVKESEEGVCPHDFVINANKCWKLDFGDLQKSDKDQYIYLISEKIDITTLKNLASLTVLKEFTRPRTGLKVYLIKLIP